jgi:hypothetical protein
MIGRLLIDECLSSELALLAIDAGHVEPTEDCTGRQRYTPV